jgi:hypothetical protein
MSTPATIPTTSTPATTSAMTARLIGRQHAWNFVIAPVSAVTTLRPRRPGSSTRQPPNVVVRGSSSGGP